MEGRHVARLILVACTVASALVAASCGTSPRDDADTTPGRSPTPSARAAARGPTASPEAPGAVRSPAPSPFDVEAWRRQTIELFGPEREFSDGSKEDYVEQARALCATEDRPDYEQGSIQEHMEETFCPYV